MLNEIIKINNNREIEFKTYEEQIITNAKNNIEKKRKLDENQIKLCNLNHERFLEYSFALSEKINLKDKKIEKINQLLTEKTKKINQLESNLELYKEKNIELSNQNKALKN